MRSSHKASGQSKAYSAQSDTLQRVGRRTHEAPSSGQRWIKDAVFSACLGNRFEQKACRFGMAGRWKTLSIEEGSTHVVDEDVCTTAEQHFLRAQTPHGQSTCSCGCASWAETHFGRVIARRRHLKLYMATVNANVCIALCRFFLYTHTRLLQPPRTHAIAVCSHAGPSRFPGERCRGPQGSRA